MREVAVYLGLGSNLGPREENLRQAVRLLARGVQWVRLSSLYETEPMGFREQPRFLNAVGSGFTRLGPLQLLTLIKGAEVALGRCPSFPNAPRPIDVDILLYGDEIIASRHLVVPHPRLAERAFVLIPLAEIAPELVPPGSERSLKGLLAEVPGKEGVAKLQGPNWVDLTPARKELTAKPSEFQRKE